MKAIAFGEKASKIQKESKKDGDNIGGERAKGYFVNKGYCTCRLVLPSFRFFILFNIFLMFIF